MIRIRAQREEFPHSNIRLRQVAIRRVPMAVQERGHRLLTIWRVPSVASVENNGNWTLVKRGRIPANC